MSRIVLASGSEIRKALFAQAGIGIKVAVPRVDEVAIKESLLADGAPPRDVADALAEAKARRVSAKHPGDVVIGCDQVLAFRDRILSKPKDPEDAKTQLLTLSGERHQLLSAAVIYEDGKPVWRHVGQARLIMRVLSEEYVERYVERNWDSIRHSVGAYRLEEEGVRLFSRIDGSYFDILGLPFLEILNYLVLRGEIEG